MRIFGIKKPAEAGFLRCLNVGLVRCKLVSNHRRARLAFQADRM
jgi:hypothetical protein